MQTIEQIHTLENSLHNHISNLSVIKQWVIDVRLSIYSLEVDNYDGREFNKITLANILNQLPVSKLEFESTEIKIDQIKLEYASTDCIEIFQNVVESLNRIYTNEQRGLISRTDYIELLLTFSKLQSSLLISI